MTVRSFAMLSLQFLCSGAWTCLENKMTAASILPFSGMSRNIDIARVRLSVCVSVFARARVRVPVCVGVLEIE